VQYASDLNRLTVRYRIWCEPINTDARSSFLIAHVAISPHKSLATDYSVDRHQQANAERANRGHDYRKCDIPPDNSYNMSSHNTHTITAGGGQSRRQRPSPGTIYPIAAVEIP